MADSRILILEGYDANPRAAKRTTKAPWNRTWCAKKIGRRVVVSRAESAGDPCDGATIFAATKKLAKSNAVREFRQERAAKKTARRPSAGQTAAQRRFAAAAHACKATTGRGGKNRSYLSCMRQKLTK